MFANVISEHVNHSLIINVLIVCPYIIKTAIVCIICCVLPQLKLQMATSDLGEIQYEMFESNPMAASEYDIISMSSIEASDDEISSSKQHKQVFQSKKSTIVALVWFVKFIIFGGVLTCLVLSKLTLIKIITELHVLSNFSIHQFTDDYDADKSLTRAANLYWMLFFIVMIPNLIAWIRVTLSGLLKKSSSHPWPKWSALLGVSKDMYFH